MQAESVSLGWLMLELKNRKQILSASQVKLGLAIKTRILLASIASDYMQVRELMLSKAIFPAFQMLSRITYRSRSARLPLPTSPAPSNQTHMPQEPQEKHFLPCVFIFK